MLASEVAISIEARFGMGSTLVTEWKPPNGRDNPLLLDANIRAAVAEILKGEFEGARELVEAHQAIVSQSAENLIVRKSVDGKEVLDMLAMAENHI